MQLLAKARSVFCYDNTEKYRCMTKHLSSIGEIALSEFQEFFDEILAGTAMSRNYKGNRGGVVDQMMDQAMEDGEAIAMG